MRQPQDEDREQMAQSRSVDLEGQVSEGVELGGEMVGGQSQSRFVVG
ncbi:hypothetical protein RI060_37475 [Streptomyces janthinus]|uniref:Uncharacterized protein n=1 Tax=Streptomyces violaceus TaxID=1936 RepID=A0ABY9UIK4_STRVL|nr:hypothetical protein [Streptomyces janthinus]WND22700.1 hypothetical protein RI060_37475 [Streptomyces janthinus]